VFVSFGISDYPNAAAVCKRVHGPEQSPFACRSAKPVRVPVYLPDALPANALTSTN
jgi:hypothetical protein